MSLPASSGRDGLSRYLRMFAHPGPVPLGFIAQIDLSKTPRVSDMLPESGWLYFFYDRSSQPWGFDPADRGACRVVYVDCDRSTLQSIKPPDDADADHLAACRAVEATAMLSLPGELPNVEYGTAAYKAYEQLREQLAPAGGILHQLVGLAGEIQHPMEEECQLVTNGLYCGDSTGYESPQAAALRPGAADWRLLLQIDTDEDGPGWMWGDCGRIFFWIREQDLRSRRFDDVWLILQCT